MSPLSLREAFRLLWRYGWQEAPDRRKVVRFAVLYLLVAGSALLAGGAVLLIVLGVLRAIFLSAPLYPPLNEALHRLGWPARGTGWEAVASPWRRLHTLLWVVLSGGAIIFGVYFLWHYGFCAQNLICKAMGRTEVWGRMGWQEVMWL